jgi:hypothetical protein
MYCHQQHTNAEQQLYDHLITVVQTELPEQLLHRFRLLFVDAAGYPDHQTAATLDKLAASKTAEQEFSHILNRCCHILINRWQPRSQTQAFIPELIALFESTPSRPVTEFSRARSARRIRELVQIFTKSEQYQALRRFAQVSNTPANPIEQSSPWNQVLGQSIHRYPYLYEHCLLIEGGVTGQLKSVRGLQVQAQQKFEQDLSRYVTSVVRCSQINRLGAVATADRLLQSVPNPTLLSYEELGFAIQQFVGKVDGFHTCRDSAQQFLQQMQHTKNYRTFKSDLYGYLTASVDPAYGSRQFNKKLHVFLKAQNPQSDSQPLSEFLVTRTCTNLLNFLVIESPQKAEHFVFIDLIGNMGATLTTGILLKIVLVCRKVRPYLEKRFAILFNHYEHHTSNGIQWLVQSLETLNVALVTNFGAVNFHGLLG